MKRRWSASAARCASSPPPSRFPAPASEERRSRALAGAAKLDLDPLGRRRLRRELLERGREELPTPLLVALLEERQAQVRDHLAFLVVVAQLAQDLDRLFEALDCGVRLARRREREAEAVQRRRLQVAVAGPANELERLLVLLDRGGRVPFTPEHRPVRVELDRAHPRVEPAHPRVGVCRCIAPVVDVDGGRGPGPGARRPDPGARAPPRSSLARGAREHRTKAAAAARDTRELPAESDAARASAAPDAAELPSESGAARAAAAPHVVRTGNDELPRRSHRRL